MSTTVSSTDLREEYRAVLSTAGLRGAYVAMLVGSVAAIVAVCWLGGFWFGPAVAKTADVAATAAPAAVKPMMTVGQALPHVLTTLLCVALLGRMLGAVLARWKQPPVIGEILAGIMLGPTLLGWLWPDAYQSLMPKGAIPYLELIAQIGVVSYLFLVGLEFESHSLHEQGSQAIAVSHASMLVPFVLGTALALGLYPIVGEPSVSFPVFALFLGLALSVTAFPVLARILTDLNLTQSPLGRTALCCAAADDVTAWCLLALVAGLAQDEWHAVISVVGLTLVYVATMWLVVRPTLQAAIGRLEAAGRDETAMVVVLSGLLASASVAEWIGIHALFGAFLLGAIVPSSSHTALGLRSKLESIVRILVLPAFFAAVGLKTEIGLMSSLWAWGLCLVVIAVATLGKFGGSYAAARLSGTPAKDAATLGWLLNTRGLMELVVLSIGLQLGVISPTLFAMLVVMALVTTWLTCPALAWFGLLRDEKAAAEHSDALQSVT